METAIVLIIVALAFAYVANTIYKQFKGKGDCACGSTNCNEQVAHQCKSMPDSMMDSNNTNL